MRSEQISVDDKTLWLSFKQGNRKALTDIYNKYIVGLYNYGARITSDRELLEDSIQDLFFNLWRRREMLGDVSSIKYYLYRALKTSILKNIHKDNKNTAAFSHSHDYLLNIIPPHEEDMIAGERQSTQYAQLHEVIHQRLTPRQKDAIILLFYDNFSYEEVADLLSMNTKSTYNLVYRALKILQTHLNTDILAFLLFLILAG